MSKPRSRGGDGSALLILGLMLTALGGGLLVERVVGIPATDALWRLWPLLLVVLGIKVLVDHYAARPAPPKEKP